MNSKVTVVAVVFSVMVAMVIYKRQFEKKEKDSKKEETQGQRSRSDDRLRWN